MSPLTELITGAKAYGWSSFSLPTAFESIATASGNGSATTLTLSSIPQTYQHLQLRIVGRRTGSSTGSSASLQMRFNSDNTSSYTLHSLYGGSGSSSVFAEGYAVGGTGGDCYVRWVFPEGGQTANVYGAAIIDIHDYASTTKNKTIRAISGTQHTANDSRVYIGSALWTKTNAISTISFHTGTAWATGTQFALYGIKGALA